MMKRDIKLYLYFSFWLLGLSAGSLLLAQMPGDDNILRIERVASGLDTPWAIDFAPDGRIFVSESPGRILVIERGRMVVWATLPVAETGEGGLMVLSWIRIFPPLGTSTCLTRSGKVDRY